MPSNKIFCVLLVLLIVLIITSCNLREDPLLPPDLDPSAYSTSSVISSYRDHLIASTNDDSYLLIRKEMIGDGGFILGDRIIFERVKPLMQRDSLALPSTASAQTGTYSFQVLRNHILLNISGIGDLAEIFTDYENNNRQHDWLITMDTWLTGSLIEPVQYYRNRIRFPVTSTGEFSILSASANSALNIHQSHSDLLRHGWFCSEGQGYSIQFGAGYLSSAGSVTISATPDLTPQEINALQSIFPSIATNSSAIRVQASGNVDGGSFALIRTVVQSRHTLQQQWTKISATDVYGWQEGENTWQIIDGELYAFVRGSATYVLGTPLPEQETVTIPLDGELKRVFIQGMWFDLRDISLPDWTMQVSLRPESQQLLNDYFSGNPFTIGDFAAWGIRFLYQGQEMESLPDDLWIEYGIATGLPESQDTRLFHCYRTPDVDKIDFKILGSVYDEDHYSYQGGYVYAGIAYSGLYLLAVTSEHPTQIRIPYLKREFRIQTSRVKVSWNDPVKQSFLELNIDLDPVIDLTHPWFTGNPYTISTYQPLAKVRMQGRSSTPDLPAEFWISFRMNAPNSSVVTFAPDVGHPRLKVFNPQSPSGDNHYQVVDGWLSFQPVFGGDYFTAVLTTVHNQRYPIAFYSLMEFNTHDFKVFTGSSGQLPTGSILTIEQRSALTDQYSILANQYDLEQTSKAYHFEVNDPTLLSIAPPRVYYYASMRAGGKRHFDRIRSSMLLFSETASIPYRIYPYYYAPQANDWNYSLDQGYLNFLLTMPGTYALYDDLAPHQQISVPVLEPLVPHYTSLYQAQLTVPPFFIPNALPIGAQVIMVREASIPNMPEALYGYRLNFRNPQGIPYNPGFIDNYITDQYPHFFIPIDDPALIPTARIIFRSPIGNETELVRVQTFSDNFRNEFVMIGNCALCFVNQPGLFIVR